MSIYVHLCSSTGEILIIQKIKKTFSRIKNILCTLLGYSMYTVFFSILEDAPKPIFQNYVFYVLVLPFYILDVY